VQDTVAGLNDYLIAVNCAYTAEEINFTWARNDDNKYYFKMYMDPSLGGTLCVPAYIVSCLLDDDFPFSSSVAHKRKVAKERIADKVKRAMRALDVISDPDVFFT
jgi:hypothetical protein